MIKYIESEGFSTQQWCLFSSLNGWIGDDGTQEWIRTEPMNVALIPHEILRILTSIATQDFIVSRSAILCTVYTVD